MCVMRYKCGRVSKVSISSKCCVISEVYSETSLAEKHTKEEDSNGSQGHGEQGPHLVVDAGDGRRRVVDQWLLQRLIFPPVVVSAGMHLLLLDC